MSAEVYTKPHPSSTTQQMSSEVHLNPHLSSMFTETCISSHLSSTTQPNVHWNLYQPSPVFSHTAKCPLKLISALTCLQPHNQMSTETYISSHLSSTTQTNAIRSLCPSSSLYNKPGGRQTKFVPSFPVGHGHQPKLMTVPQPNAERSLYQPRTAFNPTAQCRAKFISAPNSLQPNSPMPSEVYISPEQPSTQQPNAERSLYQPRTAFSPTAQSRAKFISAPNKPSTPQPKTERSLSVPNSLQPLSATKPTLVLNSLQPSNLCLSQSFQPHSHKAYHSPE